MPRILPLSATLFALAAAAAEDQAPVIIVTAERGESDLARAPQSVEVVTAEDMRDRGYALDQVDWLKELPGVSVFGANGGIDGGVTRVSLRGVDPSLTVTLLDGIPLSDPTATDGVLDPTVVNPAGTARVEVLKGAQSGLYGSGAVGGVINIISLRPTAAPEERVRATAGSFQTGGLETQATGPLGGSGGYAVGLSGLSSKGFSTSTDPAADGDPAGHEPDSLHRWSAIGRLEFTPTEGLGLRIGGLALHTAQGYDSGFPIDPEDGSSFKYTDTRRASTGGTWKRGGLTVDGDAALTLTRTVFHDLFSPVDSIYEGHESWLSIRARQRFDGGLSLGVGVDDRRDRGFQDDVGQPDTWRASSRQTGFFTTVGWSGRQTEVSLAGRVDDHSAYGTYLSGRAAMAVFTADQRWKVHAAVGNGFTAPTLYQLYGAFAPFYAGNPDLQPQTAVQCEAGLDAKPVDRVEASVTAFRTDYRRKIDYIDPDGFGPLPATYRNGDSTASVRGVEAGLDASDLIIRGADLQAWYTFLASDDGTGEDAFYTPRHSGGVRGTLHQADGRIACWESLGVTMVDGFRSFGGVVGSYSVASAAVGATVDGRWEAALRVENLFDRAYEIDPGYTTSPRAYYLSLGAAF